MERKYHCRSPGIAWIILLVYLHSIGNHSTEHAPSPARAAARLSPIDFDRAMSRAQQTFVALFSALRLAISRSSADQ